MGIKEDIHQERGFRSERQKALINIMYTDGWFRGKIKGMLKPHGLTMQQFNVLRILRGSRPRPISVAVIRERMLDKMSDASRIVDRLYLKKLVDRCTCSSDKRLVDISINEEGLKLLEQIDVSVTGFDELTSSISEEDAALLNSILDRIRG